MQNISFNIIFIIFPIYIIVLGIAYYFIFRKHHKRNKIKFYELINLIAKFYVTTTISLFIIGFGIYCIIDANSYKDNRLEVITHLTLGILVISGSIINFIFYIKKSLKDINIELRETNKKQIEKIGQILELIIFVALVFVPFYRISYLKEIFLDKKAFFIELFRDLLIPISAIFLLFKLNPCDIKEKIAKFFNI